MSAVVVRNPPGDTPTAPAPRRPDGGLYRFEMIFDGLARRAYADSATELCHELIAGYTDLDNETDQAAARIRYAVDTQVRLQAELVTNTQLADCTPNERDLLLGARHLPPQLDIWEADLPLVLVDTYYQPTGPLPRPTGRPRNGGTPDSNLIWLRPGDESELLASLAEAGVILFGELLAVGR